MNQQGASTSTPHPILVMVQSLGHGGCERDAAKLVIGLDKTRFDPRVGILREGGFRLGEVQQAGIPIVPFPITSLMNATMLRAGSKLIRYVRREGIRILHCFDVPTDMFAAPMGRIAGVRHLITAQLSYRTLAARRERTLLRLSDRLSDVVVVNSRAVGRSLSQGFQIPESKIYLCYNGVNLEEFHPGPAIRPPYLADASVVIGSVCVMRPEKRMDWLIRAFATIHPTHPNAKLLLVGSGPESTGLQNLARSLGLEGKCFFEPGRSDVAEWMRCMDIFVNASQSESFPNALLEAMACGCCVIGSDVGGIPELVEDRRTGLLFQTNDISSLSGALQWALDHPAERKTISEQGSSRARNHFSIRDNVQRLESLYTSLLKRQALPQ